jgi:hypothetical protein
VDSYKDRGLFTTCAGPFEASYEDAEPTLQLELIDLHCSDEFRSNPKKVICLNFMSVFLHYVQTALGPTQSPIQWVPGALSLGVKRQGRKAGHSPPSSAEIKEWVELYLHSPTRLHGVVLIKKSTGTSLPLPKAKYPNLRLKAAVCTDLFESSYIREQFSYWWS